jgi:hypothetical protein
MVDRTDMYNYAHQLSIKQLVNSTHKSFDFVLGLHDWQDLHLHDMTTFTWIRIILFHFLFYFSECWYPISLESKFQKSARDSFFLFKKRVIQGGRSQYSNFLLKYLPIWLPILVVTARTSSPLSTPEAFITSNVIKPVARLHFLMVRYHLRSVLLRAIGKIAG